MDRQGLEIEIMRHFGVIQSLKEDREITDDEAVTIFIEEGYAKKYAKIYYKGIPYEELRTKLFGYDK